MVCKVLFSKVLVAVYSPKNLLGVKEPKHAKLERLSINLFLKSAIKLKRCIKIAKVSMTYFPLCGITMHWRLFLQIKGIK